MQPNDHASRRYDGTFLQNKNIKTVKTSSEGQNKPTKNFVPSDTSSGKPSITDSTNCT